MSEKSGETNNSGNINLVSMKSEKDEELMGNWSPTAPTENHQIPSTIRTKLEDDISDADSTPPQATKDDYDFMKTPEYVPNYAIKNENLCDSMPTPERALNDELADGTNEVPKENNKKKIPELDQKNNCENNVNETIPDDSTEVSTNSSGQNYEEVPDDFFGDSVFPDYQVKNEPAAMPERVSNDKITDATNKNEYDSTGIDTSSADQNYEEIPDDFFGDYIHYPSYQVKDETFADVVPKTERVTNDENSEQTETADTSNKDATPNIINNDSGNNVNFYRRNDLKNNVDKTTKNGSTEIVPVQNEEALDDFLYGTFPVKSEREPTNTDDLTNVENGGDHVFVPTSSNKNSSENTVTNDEELEMMRLEFLKKLNELSDDERPCSTRSLKKRKKKHCKHSLDPEGGDYKRHKKTKHHDRSESKHLDDCVDDGQHSRDKLSHRGLRHKRERERKSRSLSADRSPTKRRRDNLTPKTTEIKIEHDFHSNEMEIILRSDEKKHVTNQPKLKLISFSNLIQHKPPSLPSLSETLEEKMQKNLNRAIKQLKAINSHGSSSSKFIFTSTMSTAKNNRSILSQINLNPSPLSSNKEFIFSQTSIGACVNLSDYGLDQPPALSQHLMRALGLDIKHLEEMRQSTKLPPKISNMIDLANSVKTENKKYQSMLYRDTDTQTDAQYFKKRTCDAGTQYCDIDLLDIKDNTDKQKYAILMMQETFNTPVYSASEEIQQNMRIYEAVKAANRKYRCN